MRPAERVEALKAFFEAHPEERFTKAELAGHLAWSEGAVTQYCYNLVGNGFITMGTKKRGQPSGQNPYVFSLKKGDDYESV